MNYKEFKYTRKAKLLNWRRTIYVVSPAPSERLGIRSKSFLKIGMAASGLFNRLSAYQTYWPGGLIIHLAAPVLQDKYSDKSTVRLVEAYLLGLQNDEDRTKAKAESFVKLDLNLIKRQLKSHPAVDFVWLIDKKNVSGQQTIFKKNNC